MPKTYSTTIYRAHHILQHAVEKYIAMSSNPNDYPPMKTSELRNVVQVTMPMVYDAVNLLIKWGHIERVRDGVHSYLYLTNHGFTWYCDHEEYCERMSSMDKAVIDANKQK